LFRVEGVEEDLVFIALVLQTMYFQEPVELLILVGEVLVVD
jgi:hypothetical protein